MTWAARILPLVVLAGLTAAAHGQDVVPGPAQQLPPVPGQEAVPAPAQQQPPPVEATPPAPPAPESAAETQKWFRLEDLAWRKGPFSIVPFGTAIFNTNYNTSSLFVGSYALYAQPNDVFNRTQFEMSPQNSFLGVNLTGPAFGEAKMSGRIDFDFRGPNPVQDTATPYFFDIYGELKTDRWRLLLGQGKDVISPLDPSVLNFTNGMVGYMPGDMGFFRAQARLDLNADLTDSVKLIGQGSINQQVIKGLEAPTDIFGTEAGWPDIQGRIAFSLGSKDSAVRTFEAGVSAHIGERVLQDGADMVLRHYRTWSFNVDMQTKLTESTRIQGEAYMGAVLGSYDGGIFQGIDPGKLCAIRSVGGWLELEQKFCERFRFHIGAGADDPNNNDLSPGTRSFNASCWANIYWDVTPQLTWAVEVSQWETRYMQGATNSPARIETTVFYSF